MLVKNKDGTILNLNSCIGFSDDYENGQVLVSYQDFVITILDLTSEELLIEWKEKGTKFLEKEWRIVAKSEIIAK